MWKCLFPGWVLAATALAQYPPSPVEFANLREDVRGLVQRVGELTLRVEQLERENAALRSRVGIADRSYATVAQLHAAINDLNRSIRSALTASKNETLQRVGTQMEQLAKQMNVALDSMAKGQAARSSVQATFSENFPQSGISYTVQKGDTVAVIARKTGTKMQDIVNANRLADPSHIVIGQVLFIPGGK